MCEGVLCCVKDLGVSFVWRFGLAAIMPSLGLCCRPPLAPSAAAFVAPESAVWWLHHNASHCSATPCSASTSATSVSRFLSARATCSTRLRHRPRVRVRSSPCLLWRIERESEAERAKQRERARERNVVAGWSILLVLVLMNAVQGCFWRNSIGRSGVPGTRGRCRGRPGVW